jgi:hypothetical protein
VNEDILPFFSVEEGNEVYEPIDPEEGNRVIAELRKLIGKASCPTIKDLLRASCDDIACLLSHDEIEEDDSEMGKAA